MKTNKFLRTAKIFLVTLGMASIFLTLFLATVSAEVRIWAQCGADADVQCHGYSCTSTDQVGCECRDQNGRVTMRRSCRFADGGGEEPEDPPVSGLLSEFSGVIPFPDLLQKMQKRIRLQFFLLVFCCLPLWGQQPLEMSTPPREPAILKRQIAADDLENQAKGVSVAAVRVLVNYKIASWLWKKGVDDTGRAAPFAIRALEELYHNKAEIPDLYFNGLSRDIFSLLDANDKKTARKLSLKYERTPEDMLQSAEALLNQKGGEKAVTDKILETLGSGGELSFMTVWLMDELRERNSSELLRILTKILALEESGANNFTDKTLSGIVDFFRSKSVSNELRLRFYRMVISRARNSIQTPDGNMGETFDLLYSVLNDINLNAPDLFAEASLIQAALSTRVPRAATESREIFRRTEEATDHLSATLAEADNTDDVGIKRSLWTNAVYMAIKAGKFILAVDLLEKLTDGVKKDDVHAIRWHDQELDEVLQAALKQDDVNSAKYATRKITDKIYLADALRKTADYFFRKQDVSAANENLDDAIRTLVNLDNDLRKVNCLIRLISTASRINPSTLYEVTGKAAKAINALPSLKIDDKPGTDAYKNYVSSMMAVNYNLLPALGALAKENRNDASDFVSRITRKEIKIVGDYALLVDSLNAETSRTALAGKK